MLRISFGVALLAALLGTYLASPMAGWVALFATSTFAVASHIRRRDEGTERALRPIDK